ncbi:MAG TPA: hypothetical protein VJ579_04850 [Candidatus Paceibacterota bacterium]|nr:hypothetical protein [Candidatus Paceibacterota bacterium]
MKQTLFDMLIVMVVPALIFVGYITMHNIGGTQELIQTITGGNVPKADEPGARTTLALNELDKIQLDSSIFSLTEFKSLKFSQATIPDEPIGRKNPFTD